MDTNITVEKAYPPRIHTAFIKGFNTLANNAYLLILPFLIDIFLWLGPNFSISDTLNKTLTPSFSTVISSYEKQFQQQISQPGMAEVLHQLQLYKETYHEFVASFNFFSFISTLPIGVPSLLSFEIVNNNPFGTVNKIAASLPSYEFLALVGFLILGSFIGGIYFSEIGRRTNQNEAGIVFKFSDFIRNVGWMMLINFVVWLAIMLIVIPFSSLFFTLLLNYVSNEFVLYLFTFTYLLILFWTIIPMIYTPHGVIILQQDPINAFLCSRRLVRYYMPGTGFFIMISLLFYQMFNEFLWLMPKSSSFMLLGGIFGHAFICTGLIASSFIYFQDGVKWMKHNLKMIAQQSNQTSRPFQA